MTTDEHLFIKLMEECAEVQHRVSKVLQFGPNEMEPEQPFDNAFRLRGELNDILAVIVILEEELLIMRPNPEELARAIDRKREKIAKFLKYSQELGCVQP